MKQVVRILGPRRRTAPYTPAPPRHPIIESTIPTEGHRITRDKQSQDFVCDCGARCGMYGTLTHKVVNP